MINKFKRTVAVLLMFILCMSMFSVASSAKITFENGNVWYGDELAVDVTAGAEGYTYMSLFRKPAHGYEFCGHFMGDGEGPQTFVIIDTVDHDGTTWTPSGLYDPMESNYEVTYCCDVETMIVDGIYYKRLNLEDSEYYDEAAAAKIRAIVTNSYPYVSLEDMKADLAENGYAYAEKLTRNEIIAAVQCAIWASANNLTADDLRYQKSYKVSDNLQWGYPLHDTSMESGLDISGKRMFKTYEDVGVRIDSLVDYLLAQDATYAEKNQIVITKIEMNGDPIYLDNDIFTVKLRIELNNSGSGYEDDISITLTVGDDVINIPVEFGKETYELFITTKRDETVKAVVACTQVLPRGVYFYAPKAADVSGAFDENGDSIPDGIATSREVSQNLVSVAMGETPVYAEAELSLSDLNAPETVEVSGCKTWDDESNKDGNRPNSININLLANGSVISSKTVTENDGWTWQFTDLDKYTSDGELICYSVSEEPVFNYISSVVGYDITNVYEPQKTEIAVQKIWDDNNNQDGFRPDSITVNLQADGEIKASAVLSESNNWSYIFCDILKYQNGTEISYSVSEEFVYGYELSVTGDMFSGFVITNKHIPETVSVSGSKTWIDSKNIKNTRPESITVNLFANGEYVMSKNVSEETEWTYSFDNLAKYNNGEIITYSITEDPVDGYKTEIFEYNIINIVEPEEIIPETIDIIGYKTWIDDDNKDGKRPYSITVYLHANGRIIDSKLVTELSGWRWSFENLDKYNSYGSEIKYEISEGYVEDYTPKVNGYNITNIYEPQRTEVVVQKIWNDNNNLDGCRPDNIIVILEANGIIIDTAVLSESNGWSYVFSNLDKYENGKEICYNVYDESVYGYESSAIGNMYTGFVLTNTHIPENVSVNGEKTWIDNNNINNTRPESVTVNLFANGEYIMSKTVSEETGWTYSFDNLAKYNNGERIEYSITEDPIDGYGTEIIEHDIINYLIIPKEPTEEEDVPPIPPSPIDPSEEDDETIKDIIEDILDEDIQYEENPETFDDSEKVQNSVALFFASALVVLLSFVILKSVESKQN